MRVTVEVVRVAEHQIRGEVVGADGGPAHRFCGWLDFVRVLEALVPAPDGDGAPRGGLTPAD